MRILNPDALRWAQSATLCERCVESGRAANFMVGTRVQVSLKLRQPLSSHLHRTLLSYLQLIHSAEDIDQLTIDFQVPLPPELTVAIIGYAIRHTRVPNHSPQPAQDVPIRI